MLNQNNKRKRLSFKSVSLKFWIALISSLGVVAILGFVYLNLPTEIDRLSLTYLDNLVLSDLAVQPVSTFKDNLQIRDYTVYGETLSLYANPYTFNEKDPLYGRNALLKNVETGAEYHFTFGGGADSGIELGRLEPGVYEIYGFDQNYTPLRLYTEEPLQADLVTTLRRNERVNTVRLDADKNFYSKFGIETDKNYMYLTVTSSLPRVKVVDVMIDPSGLVPYTYGNGHVEGYTSDTFNEADASIQLARQIQLYLDDAGLRVELTRDEDEKVAYYGQNGRLGKGYENQAKVYLGLTMEEGKESRPYLLSSPFTAGALANTISYTMKENGLELTKLSNLTRLDEGTGYDALQVNAEGQQTQWSAYPQIRETGGKATFAGTLADVGSNESYNQPRGMESVVVFFASTDSADSQNYFYANQDTIARSIAKGILEYFQIPAESNKTDDGSTNP